MAPQDEREEELETLRAIYPELKADDHDPYAFQLELAVTPSTPLLIRFIPTQSSRGRYAQTAINANAHIERDVALSHLPPLFLQVTLPDMYPTDSPPTVRLSSKKDWLPAEKLKELEDEASKSWDDYGHCQIMFAYIDYLQQVAERGFDLDQSADGCLVLPASMEKELRIFDEETKLATFRAGTYDCGVCLEPKKGYSCHRMKRCDHVFCKDCLKDFYNNAITEGDVATIRCLAPDCGKDAATLEGRRRKRKAERTLHPRELLGMGIEESMVRRYVELKRKKKLEVDKTTVYCPRTWCQGPARSVKYPPIPADLSAYVASESSSDAGTESDSDLTASKHDSPPSPSLKKKVLATDPADRLAICEKCQLAFCRVCFMGWHGPFARCFPRDPNELSAEEKASYDYIRLNTSPCPTCNSPAQKTMGCNHMKCFQCNTHFCYLCGAWLDGSNPYQHFNRAGTECYQRLWELEEGDDGQGPDDGRGFRGARGWEQIALEAAREAEAAEQAAAVMQAEEDARAAEFFAVVPERVHDIPLVVAMAQAHLDDDHAPPPGQQRPNRAGRRQRNPFPARPPAPGNGQAVRNHERNQGNGRLRRRPVANEEERQQQELQRFLEMAQRDEEDGWDSDELGEDEGFEIR